VRWSAKNLDRLVAGDAAMAGNNDARLAERWPLILLTLWGGIIAALVAWFDKNPLAAIACLVTGVAIGCLTPSLLDRLSLPIFDWYVQFWKDDARENRRTELFSRIVGSDEFKRLTEAGHSQEELAEFVWNGAPESEEYKRLIEEDGFSAVLALPVFSGLFHGSLLGGIVGALYPLDPNPRLPAWQAAALGVVAGPIIVSFLAAIMCAATTIPKDLPASSRLSRRLLMIVSPLFVFPVAWHCVKHLLRRRPSKAI
jgi:hypothetical protein